MTGMAPVHAPDPRPLAGEPLALDLLNTQWLAAGTPVDLLATPAGTRAWLAAAGAPATLASGTRQALVQARQAIRDVVSGQGGPAALDRLNAVLGHGRLRLSIGPPINPGQTLEVDDPAWQPPACVLWFFDTTRNGTRRWCSMAACGNRAKARRHYDRIKKPDPR